MSASASWAAHVDPEGRWQDIPADRLLRGDVLWGGGEIVAVDHERDPWSLGKTIRVACRGGVSTGGPWPGDALVRIDARQVDPNRLGLMAAAVRRCGVPEAEVDQVARDLVARGTPLLQARFVLAGDVDPAAWFNRSNGR